MIQPEFKIDGYNYEFRIREMSAVDVLALQSQIKMDSTDSAKNFFNVVLEQIEVKGDNTWLPVKEKNREIYYPPEVKDNILLTKALINYFIHNFLKEVFQKSSASK